MPRLLPIRSAVVAPLLRGVCGAGYALFCLPRFYAVGTLIITRYALRTFGTPVVAIVTQVFLMCHCYRYAITGDAIVVACSPVGIALLYARYLCLAAIRTRCTPRCRVV